VFLGSIMRDVFMSRDEDQKPDGVHVIRQEVKVFTITLFTSPPLVRLKNMQRSSYSLVAYHLHELQQRCQGECSAHL